MKLTEIMQYISLKVNILLDVSDFELFTSIIDDLKTFVGSDVYQIVGYKGRFTSNAGFYKIPSYDANIEDTLKRWINEDVTLQSCIFFPESYKSGIDDIRINKNLKDKKFISIYKRLNNNQFWIALRDLVDAIKTMEFFISTLSDVDNEAVQLIESYKDEYNSPFADYAISVLSTEKKFLTAKQVEDVVAKQFNNEFTEFITKTYSNRYEFLKEFNLLFKKIQLKLRTTDVYIDKSVQIDLAVSMLDEKFLARFYITPAQFSSVLNTIKQFRKLSSPISIDTDLLKKLVNPSDKLSYFMKLAKSTSFDDPTEAIKNLIKAYIDIFSAEMQNLISHPFFVLAIMVTSNKSMIPELFEMVRDAILAEIMNLFSMMVKEIKSAFADLFSFM